MSLPWPTLFLILTLLVCLVPPKSASAVGRPNAASTTVPALPDCVAFSAYVGEHDPDFGPHPPPALIDALLDALVLQSTFRCIQVYGVLNGLDYIPAAAQQRGISVVQVIWLDTDTTVNAASIAKGIEVAKAYPGTITRLSCGSEVRTRHGLGLTGPIADCIAQLRAADVTQPIGNIESWWVWCNEQQPCHAAALASELDWIGVNAYPWWENKFSPLYPCTAASGAAAFAVARLQEVASIYPGKRTTLTEFGWPAGPNGYTETNVATGQQCGVASEENQTLVVNGTRTQLESAGYDGVMFEAFREGAWKVRVEASPVGSFWGQCSGTAPYACKTTLVDCQPRAGVVLATVLDGPGRLRTTVTAGAGVLREVRFGDPDVSPPVPFNALISIPNGPTDAPGSFTYVVPPLTRELTFVVKQQSPGSPMHVPLVILDGCPAWKSFVGAGASAWGPAPLGLPAPAPADSSQPQRPSCTPRPAVAVTTTRRARGQIEVTLKAGAGALRELRFASVSNVQIDIGDRRGQTGPFSYVLPTMTDHVTFQVRRLNVGLPTAVSMVAVDACGTWPTFVGGGPDAF